MDIGHKKQFHLPKKVTQEVIDKILKDIAEGGTRRHSAEANGIVERHFYNMISQGQYDLANGNETSMYAKLVQSLREIELKEIKECRKGIISHKKGHTGKQWTLERVYWRDFGSNAETRILASEVEELKQMLKGANINVSAESNKENQGSEE